MKGVCLWGTSNRFYATHVSLFKELSTRLGFRLVTVGGDGIPNLDVYVFKQKNMTPFRKLLLPLYWIITFLNILTLFVRLDKRCDIHIVHYLNIWYLLGLFIIPIRGTVVYIPYGADWRPTSNNSGKPKSFLYRMLFKFVLKRRVSTIIVESRTIQRLIAKNYDVHNFRVVQIFPIHEIFYNRDISEQHCYRKDLEIVFFSPRALYSHFNHHVLLEILRCSRFKQNLKVIFIHWGAIDDKYPLLLKTKAKRYGIQVEIIKGPVDRKKMAQLFLISDFNVNIPNDDQFGMSIMEGAVMGSIPVLNGNVKSYREFMSNKNAILIDLSKIKESAKDIDEAIEKLPKLKKKMHKYNMNIFRHRRIDVIMSNLSNIISTIALKGGAQNEKNN